MVRRGGGEWTSISFNFHARYRVKIRSSDNPRQKDTISDIIWCKRKKCVIYRLGTFLNKSCGPVKGVKDQLVLPVGYS